MDDDLMKTTIEKEASQELQQELITKEEYKKIRRGQVVTWTIVISFLIVAAIIVGLIFYYKEVITVDPCKACEEIRMLNIFNNR